MKLLDGLHVLEWSRGAASAAAGRELARWGAEVIVLTPPDDAPLRRAQPMIDDVSLLEVSLNRGKEAQPDCDPSDAEKLRAQLSNADALVTDAPLEELSVLLRGGVSRETPVPDFPKLVVLHLSPFGSEGPYADYDADDLIIQALSGFAGANGVAGRPPLAAPAAIIPRAVGVLAATGALAALLERRRSGRGQWIEVAEQEAASTLIMSLRSEFSERAVPRVGGPEGWAEVLPTRDGYVTLSPWSKETLRNLPIAFDVPPPPQELLEAEGRFAPQEPSRDYVASLIAQRTATEVFHGLSELGAVMAWHRTAADLLDDPQLAALDYVRETEHPGLGKMRGAGPPAQAAAAASDAAPSREPFDQRPTPSASSGPLDGLRVVDFTHAWLGPYASALLADLGAEVIKIEGPKRPDLWRYDARDPLPVAAPDAHSLNVRANFNMANRNKRTVSLALDTEQGRDLALQLVARADLALENFRPRVLQNLRLTHDHLRAVNPDIALVSFSGFGSRGPYANYRANGGTTEGNAGWDMLFGYRDEPPAILGTMQADPICGAQMAAAALSAVWRILERPGESLHVEGSMFESAVGYIDEHLLAASLGLEPPPRDGNRAPAAAGWAPRECFRCKDGEDASDRWIAISVPDDAVWASFAAASGLDRDEWRTAAGRVADIDALEAAIGAWTRDWDAQTLQSRLQAAGVPAGAVHSTLTHLRDPHLQARGWWRYLTHPDSGVRQYQGAPWRFARTRTQCDRPAPRMGEHTVEILRDVLHCGDDLIAQWLESGVIATLTERADPAEPPPQPISPR